MSISSIDDLADTHLAAMTQLDPCSAARLSISGSETQLTDYSPAGVAARAERLRDTLTALSVLTPTDADRVTAGLLGERVAAMLVQYEAGDLLGVLAPVNGPLVSVMSAFFNMPHVTNHDWDVLEERLSKVPAALASIRAGIAAAISNGRAPALRQVRSTVNQCSTWAGEPGSGGWFAGFASERPALAELAVSAGQSLAALGDWLTREVGPVASPVDGAGEERYMRAARFTLGTNLDPLDAYEWAWDELHRLEADARSTIDQILPGATLVETKAHLDDVTAIEGRDEWLAWLQDLTDRTLVVPDAAGGARRHRHRAAPRLRDPG